MRWFTKHLRNVGMASVSMLFLLTCLALIPLSAVSAHEGTSGVATPTTVTVLATPTEDATVTALNKEKLAQEVLQLQKQNESDFFGWLQANATLLSTLLVVVGGIFTLYRYFAERRTAQDKELKDRENEREKRAEERFQAAVTGLGDEKEGVRIGAAILLRTFLRPDYEQFYTQTFDLAVAHLRLPRTSTPSEDPDGIPHSPTDSNAPLPLTTLRQALIGVFKEAFPLARDSNDGPSGSDKGAIQLLDATGIRLDNAYLREAKLKRIWMPLASLQHANLIRTDLSETNLSEARFHNADLRLADLRGANLQGADLQGADLRGANLQGADLRSVWFRKALLNSADLRGAKFGGSGLSGIHFVENALSLAHTDLRGAEGLTKEQRDACKVKGAIIDENLTISAPQSTVVPSSPPQSNNTQAPSTPPAQENTLSPDPDGSTTPSSQQEPEL